MLYEQEKNELKQHNLFFNFYLAHFTGMKHAFGGRYYSVSDIHTYICLYRTYCSLDVFTKKDLNISIFPFRKKLKFEEKIQQYYLRGVDMPFHS